MIDKKLMKQMKNEMLTKRQRWTDEDIETLKECVKNGITNSKIIKEYCFPYRTVQAISLKMHNLKAEK
jgi:hypothetical protein